MVRSGASRATDAVLLLLAASLPAALLALVHALPVVELARVGLAWLPATLAGALAIAATLLAGACLVTGLRRSDVAALAGAAAGAAVAGGGLALALGGDATPMDTALPVASLLFAITVAADRAGLVVHGSRRRMGLAGIGLVVAEGSVLAGLVPAAVAQVRDLEPLLLGGGATVFTLAAFAARSRWVAAVGACSALGSAGLLLDRGIGLELVIGLLLLLGATLAGGRFLLERRIPELAAEPIEHLPRLAAHVSDAVLQFDGRLGLIDWNETAGTLLGLDQQSVGTRLEDLLGLSIADLPAGEGASLVATGVGGLDIRLHRSADGIVAVVSDRHGRPDVERLGRELRGTIEELLQARRTIELQRAEIERAATIDLLTGVASRGAILERLRIEIAQARRYQHPVALVLLNVDRMADINRRHGVAGGDALLREVALRMRLRVREADALGRSGSDGFLAILPHTDESRAATFAAALRHRLALRPLSVGDELLEVTVSIGVAVMRAGEDLDLDGLLERAGEALDSARSAGGDRIALDRLHGLARLEEHRSAAESEPDAEADSESVDGTR